MALLSDFGVSRILQTSGFTTSNIAGTCRWMPVELLVQDDDDGDVDQDIQLPVTPETDIWSFAMTILEVGIFLKSIN